MIETWWQYVTRISGRASNQRIAAAAGVVPSQITRWSEGQPPGAKQVIHFARHHHRSPLEGLIVAGYLNQAEVEQAVEIVRSLSDLTDAELVGELGFRLLQRRIRKKTQDGLSRIASHLTREAVGVEEPDHRQEKRG